MEVHTSPGPKLPHVYNLIERDVVDSAVDEARRRALQGAEEGTCVWAHEQTAARDERGRPRPSPRGNLYVCLVLRPEYPVPVTLQLNYVAAVSLGLTVAEAVPPMTALRYRWPNTVLLNDAKVGEVSLLPGPISADVFEWLLLGVTANVTCCGEHPGSNETCLADEGAEASTAAAMLHGFCRHFLSWINRWADDGFSPIHRAWTQRADGMGETRRIDMRADSLEGRLRELDDEGALILDARDGVRRLTVSDYYGIRNE